MIVCVHTQRLKLSLRMDMRRSECNIDIFRRCLGAFSFRRSVETQKLVGSAFAIEIEYVIMSSFDNTAKYGNILLY